MALENGLKPFIQGFKGTGFNRSLLEPYSFENCWKGDGINDYLSITESIGETFGDFQGQIYSMFFWVKLIDGIGSIYALYSNRFGFNDRTYVRGSTANTLGWQYGSGGEIGSVTLFNNEVALWGITVDHTLGKYTSYKNNLITAENVTLPQSTAVNKIILDTTIGTDIYSGYWQEKLDNFIIYNRKVEIDEVKLLYNNGFGANPKNINGIKIWYDFNKAEIATDLYPLGLPSGWLATDWGVRNKIALDTDTKKYHAKAINMTNNATLGGVLQPW